LPYLKINEKLLLLPENCLTLDKGKIYAFPAKVSIKFIDIEEKRFQGTYIGGVDIIYKKTNYCCCFKYNKLHFLADGTGTFEANTQSGQLMYIGPFANGFFHKEKEGCVDKPSIYSLGKVFTYKGGFENGAACCYDGVLYLYNAKHKIYPFYKGSWENGKYKNGIFTNSKGLILAQSCDGELKYSSLSLYSPITPLYVSFEVESPGNKIIKQSFMTESIIIPLKEVEKVVFVGETDSKLNKQTLKELQKSEEKPRKKVKKINFSSQIILQLNGDNSELSDSDDWFFFCNWYIGGVINFTNQLTWDFCKTHGIGLNG